jgi:hypothetical protein
MQWYVYLITVPAVVFLGQVTFELIGGPIQTICFLRRRALERMLAFRNTALPGPRELAVSSRQIREHDQATRNTGQAHRTFADLGTQLLAFSESEPTIGAMMRLCGLDIVLAGHELINLSEIYASAKVDSDEVRRSIEEAHHAISSALSVSHGRSGGDYLIKIRLEPMHLRDATSSRDPKRLRRPYLVSPRLPPRATPASSPAAAREPKVVAYR